eukprot:4534836-Karenia_brevis.AAC.1
MMVMLMIMMMRMMMMMGRGGSYFISIPYSQARKASTSTQFAPKWRASCCHCCHERPCSENDNDDMTMMEMLMSLTMM